MRYLTTPDQNGKWRATDGVQCNIRTYPDSVKISGPRQPVEAASEEEAAATLGLTPSPTAIAQAQAAGLQVIAGALAASLTSIAADSKAERCKAVFASLPDSVKPIFAPVLELLLPISLAGKYAEAADAIEAVPVPSELQEARNALLQILRE